MTERGGEDGLLEWIVSQKSLIQLIRAADPFSSLPDSSIAHFPLASSCMLL